MTMRVHHLNCATMCPLLGRFVVNSSGTLVAHVLLVETSDGLLLVDTGFGLGDIAEPRRRLSSRFVRIVRPRLDAAEAAVTQVERLGFARRDVRHIAVTHLDDAIDNAVEEIAIVRNDHNCPVIAFERAFEHLG